MTDRKIGLIGGEPIRLAHWIPPNDRYRRTYRGLGLGEQEVGVPVPDQRVWRINQFTGGEQEGPWTKEHKGYRYSDSIRPVRRGEGIELGPLRSRTQVDAGGNFTQGGALGVAGNLLRTGRLENDSCWTWITDEWTLETDPGGSVGSFFTSFAGTVGADNLTYFASSESSDIFKIDPEPTGGSLWNSNFAAPVVLVEHLNTLYAVNRGGDLYTVSKTASNTETLIADFSGNTDYSWSDPVGRRNMKVTNSDEGPIWLHRMASGWSQFRTYNPASQTQDVIGGLPPDFTPDSIHWSNGIVFVGVRATSRPAGFGDGYVYYVAGAQRGFAGPFRRPVVPSDPVMIAGMSGDDLVVVWGENVWAYNISAGGIYHLATLPSSIVAPYGAIVYDNSIFISSFVETGNTRGVDILEVEKRSINNSLTWYSGYHDFDFALTDKILHDVTVFTDPLPADSSVELGVAVDGSNAYQSMEGSLTGADETSLTFTTATSIVGKTFEIAAIIDSNDSDTSPVVRDIHSRVSAIGSNLEWALIVDCTSDPAGEQTGHGIIAYLNSLRVNKISVEFQDPWQKQLPGEVETNVVTVTEVGTPEASPDGMVSALVRLRKKDLI